MTLSRALGIIVLLLLAARAQAQQTTMVPVTVDGEQVRLQMRIYKPEAPGPLPTLVFHHGSTGRGTDPSIFKSRIDYPPLAQFFVKRGWAVVFPARRGRAGGKGAFHTFVRPPDLVSGHRIVERPGLWSTLVEEYLKRQGLPSAER